MNLPILLLGFVLSTLYGAGFHFWKGGNIYRLFLFLILSWAGFWVGHILGILLNFSFWEVGVLNTGMASLGSAVFLFVGHWLSLIDIERK